MMIFLESDFVHRRSLLTVAKGCPWLIMQITDKGRIELLLRITYQYTCWRTQVGHGRPRTWCRESAAGSPRSRVAAELPQTPSLA